jgi:hypothetical protein
MLSSRNEELALGHISLLLDSLSLGLSAHLQLPVGLDSCDSHKCMGKPHFRPIDHAIAHAFDEREDVMVLGIEYYALNCAFYALDDVAHRECISQSEEHSVQNAQLFNGSLRNERISLPSRIAVVDVGSFPREFLAPEPQSMDKKSGRGRPRLSGEDRGVVRGGVRAQRRREKDIDGQLVAISWRKVLNRRRGGRGHGWLHIRSFLLACDRG